MIDRMTIVTTHDPVMRQWNPYAPLSVGNGEFAFTCDLTGLQTFPAYYQSAMPLCTMSQWGWHSAAFDGAPGQNTRRAMKRTGISNGEREVPYLLEPGDEKAAYQWLRENPHRCHLGRVGFHFPRETVREDIQHSTQRLDLYHGCIDSRFSVHGEPVHVVTCVHPHRDVLAVRIESPLLALGLQIVIELPAPSPMPCGGIFDQPGTHQSSLVANQKGRFTLLHVMDDDQCLLEIAAPGAHIEQADTHAYHIGCEGGVLEMTIAFDRQKRPRTDCTFEEARLQAAAYWADYWEKGGFVSIGGGGEKGAELQRRIILSQYLTAIQCAGSFPPAETGLTSNSWYGKFHLEMHWWHSAHFPLWGKPECLERSLWFYDAILPKARALAHEQGYLGARWPKMIGPDAQDSPSPVGPLLIWQQPHPIYYAELLYRLHPDKETLRRYETIVHETAEFMVAYPRYDAQTDAYCLGPGLIPAQENFNPADVVNPPFELEYWSWGLRTANRWRERMGLAPDPRYAEMVDKLARPVVHDGLYWAHENCPGTYAPPFNRDHPSMTGALGILPGTLIDPAAMDKTLDTILSGAWPLEEDVWGWDFPMLAMCAARLGRPQDAAALLVYPSYKNQYLPNGHNKQHTVPSLPLYLPGNGGLLFAVAMMCAGWDGCGVPTPGFPDDWAVEWEGLWSCP